MISMKALVVGAVGAGCLSAAGLGGYLAVRDGLGRFGRRPRICRSRESEDPNGRSGRSRTGHSGTPGYRPRRRPRNRRSVPRPAVQTPAAAAPANRSSDRASTTTAVDQRPTSSEHAGEPVASTPTDPEPTHTAGPVDEIQIPSPETPRVTLQELTVGANGVIGIRLETLVSSDTAKVEDRVTARVVRDVTVDGRVAVPAGSTVEGIVTEVERGGRFRERARLGVRFTSVVLSDNTRVNVSTEPIYRTGDSPTGEATSKIGAATVVGTIIGAAIGGKKGAAIGGATGAAGGTGAVMASGPNHAVLTAGTSLTVRLTEPATFTVPLER